MTMRPLAALLAATAFVTVAADTAQAQFNSSLLRTQTRVIERSVARNLERVFKPRLVVSKGATGPVSALTLSEDERLLMTATGNHTVRVWDLWAGREVARLVGHRARITAIAIAKNGSQAVSVGEDKLIKVWNLKQLGEVATLPEQAQAVTGVAINDDGSQLFTASADGKVRQWSLPAARLEREWDAHGGGFTRVALSPDGKRLISGGADDKVRVWDSASGAKLAEMDAGDSVLALAVNANGAIATGTADGDIRLWDAGFAPTGRFANGRKVTSVAFLPGNDRVVSGDGDGAVKLWSAGGKEPLLLGKHDAGVSFVAANRDGGMALSGSEDGTSRLWNLRNNQPLLTLISTESGWAVVDAKGRYDGNQAALDGIDWKADDVTANIDDFAETHYQAALLPRTLREGEEIPDANSIPDGARYPANIRFVSPTAAGDAGSRKVVVEVVAEDNGGGVSEVRLYRNGKVVPRGIGTVNREEVDGKARLVGRFEVDLQAGRNTLSATAVNTERLESRPEQLVVDGGAAMPAGKMHLLVVGINTYAQSELDLSYAKPDAQAIAQFLSGGGRASMPIAETVTLEDQQATKDNILAALRKFRTVPAEDVVVVYMAGHGVSVGDDWYFISHEIKIPRRPEKLAGMALSSADLKAEMEALGADRTMLLLDTCHSGTAATPLSDYRGMKSLRLLARSVGTHVLAATDKNQFAVELEALGHGIFTYTLLAGLNGEAARPADKQVKASELIRFVEEKVPTLSRKFADYAQYPTGYSRGSDFAVAAPTK
ncbi:MAG: caspase family protein [Bacteroidales bacterium]